MAVLGDRLFMTTIDAHLLALDMATGAVMYDVTLEDYKRLFGNRRAAGRQGQGHSRNRRRRVRHPRFHRGVRCRDRQEIWRFNTVAGPDEFGGNTWPKTDAYERGGGSIWVTGTYDPE